MPNTVVVLTENTLLPSDVEHIRTLAGPDVGQVRVIVPTGADRSVVTSFLDHLAVLDLKEAWEDLTGANDVTPEAAEAAAEDVLRGSVAALRAGGLSVSNAVVADDVVAALRAELAELDEESDGGGVIQVFAVTQPRAVEDAFHRGWADRIEDQLGVAVLHFYTGTSYLEA